MMPDGLGVGQTLSDGYDLRVIQMFMNYPTGIEYGQVWGG